MPGTGGSMAIRNAALGFSFGVVAAHWFPAAQPLWACCMCAGVAMALARRVRILGAALVGLGWGAVHGLDALDRQIDPGCAQASVAGRIVGLPSEEHGRGMIARRFVFEPETASCELRGRLRLMWLDGPSLRSNERFSLVVRLKSPRAGANTHGFDAEAWFVRDKLAATGYVVSGRRLEASESVAGIQSLGLARQELHDELARLPLVHGGVLAALTLGDKGAIPTHKVDLYRRTGTMHLLVISGLHVGVVTALGFLAGRAFGGLTTLSSRATGVVSALLLTSAYVVIAGGGLSLVRAFAMSLAGMVALLAGRSSAPSAAFAFALAVVLVIDPMAPLGSGFWLSFGAVAVLLGFFVPRPRRRSWLISAVVAQLAIATVFVPATTGITGLVHPLGIGCESGRRTHGDPTPRSAGPVGRRVDCRADRTLAANCGRLRRAVARNGPRVRRPDYTDLRGLPGRLAGVGGRGGGGGPRADVEAGARTAGVHRRDDPAAPPSGVAVGTRGRHGPRCGPRDGRTGRDGESHPGLRHGTHVPFRSRHRRRCRVAGGPGPGLARIDRLVLSHGDVDHVGGAASVLAGMTVGEVLAGESVPGIETQPCHAGSGWHWDGVAFSVLSPTADHRYTGTTRRALS